MKKCMISCLTESIALISKYKRWIIPLSIGIITLILDVVTKYLVETRLPIPERLEFLGGFLRISLVHNKGGVFGIFQGYQHIFLILSIVVLILMIVFWIFEKNKSMIFNICMSLIASGAIGNIIDRIIPGREGVVDFISIGVDGVYRWPSFNIADSCIVVGAILLVIVFYKSDS